MTEWPARLVLVGAGKMGGAMAQGWLAAGLFQKPLDLTQALAPGHLFVRDVCFGNGPIDVGGHTGLVRARRMIVGWNDQLGQLVQ